MGLFLAIFFVFKIFLLFLQKIRLAFEVSINKFIIYLSFVLGAALLSGCNFKLKPFDEELADTLEVKIQRYDRLERLYLKTGDFSALQQMSTDYPIETRTLIEKILGLGNVDEPDINNKLLSYFQDSTLQAIISDAEIQYAKVDDLNKQLTDAFHKLKAWIPGIKVPLVYAQVCALDQSIVIGDESVGICLDKYLGSDYPLYARYYDKEQRQTMQRSYIVPDLLSFYLLSIYQLPNFREVGQEKRDLHLAKIQWVVNKVLGRKFFRTHYLGVVDKYMHRHPQISVEELLSSNDFSRFDFH